MQTDEQKTMNTENEIRLLLVTKEILHHRPTGMTPRSIIQTASSELRRFCF